MSLDPLHDAELAVTYWNVILQDYPELVERDEFNTLRGAMIHLEQSLARRPRPVALTRDEIGAVMEALGQRGRVRDNALGKLEREWELGS